MTASKEQQMLDDLEQRKKNLTQQVSAEELDGDISPSDRDLVSP